MAAYGSHDSPWTTPSGHHSMATAVRET